MSGLDTRVLLIAEDAEDAGSIGAMLHGADGHLFALETVGALLDAKRRLATGRFDVVLLDLDLTDAGALDRLRRLVQWFPRLPVLVITDVETEGMGGRAVTLGAQDYLIKSELDGALLARAIRFAIERQQLVAKLKRYAHRLKTSHLRLQSILEYNADAILLINRAGAVFYLNPAAQDMLGVNRGDCAEDVLGVRITGPCNMELSLERPRSGHPRAVDMRVAEVDWEGEPAYLAALRDSTARTELQNALHRAANEWQSTFDAVEDLVVVIDRDHRILRANQAAADLLGPERILGAHCYELFHGKDSMPDDCPSMEAFATGHTCELQRHEPHLGDRWLDLVSYPITDEDGEVSKVVHVARDVTQEHDNEELQLTLDAKNLVLEDLRRITEMKSQFIEVVSHELRTPMTVIRSGVGLLLDNSLGDLSAEQRKFLDLIDKNIERLSRFATDVLSLSRLESGHYKLNPRLVHLGDALRPTLDLLRARCHEEGLTLVSLLDQPEPGAAAPAGEPLPHVVVDVDALSQVVTNLVNNAVMHCTRGTRIEVSARRLDTATAEVVVRDNGPGISEEMRAAVFERYVQGENDQHRTTGRRGYHGTGIGLAVCRELMRRMGGSIKLDPPDRSGPEAGKTGAVFRLALPTGDDGGELLFGRLAVQAGHIDRAQLVAALERQEASGGRLRLGQVMVEQGLMTREQVDALLAQQKRAMERPHPHLPGSVGETLLGQLAVRAGLVTSVELHRCLRRIDTYRNLGRRVRLGEVLVSEGLLTTEQVMSLLVEQRRHLARCGQCGVQYNVSILDRSHPVRCPQCGGTLLEVTGPADIAVAADL